MSKAGYTSNTIKNTLWKLLDQLLRKGFSIFVTLVLAWYLVPEDFGLLAMIVIFVEISAVLVSGGFVDAIIRKRYLTQYDLDTVFITNILLSFIIYIALFFSSPFIASSFNQPLLESLIQIAGLSVIFQAFSVVPSALLRKKLLFKQLLKITLPSSMTGGIVALVMAYYEYGVLSLIAQMLITTLMTSILYWRMRLWRLSYKFSFRALKKLIGFSGFLLAHQIVRVVFNNLFSLVLAKFYPAAILGNYYFAERIKTLVLGQLVNAIEEVTFSVFSKIEVDKLRLKLGFSKVLSIMSYILFPALIFSTILSPLAFSVILPEKWSEAAEILQLILLISIFYPILLVIENIFKSLGEAKLVFGLGILARVLMVSVLFVTFSHGLKIMILGQGLVGLLMLLAHLFYLNKHIGYGLWDFMKEVMPTLSLTSLIAFTLYFFINGSNLNEILLLISAAFIAIASYLTLSYLFKFKSIKLLQEQITLRKNN